MSYNPYVVQNVERLGNQHASPQKGVFARATKGLNRWTANVILKDSLFWQQIAEIGMKLNGHSVFLKVDNDFNVRLQGTFRPGFESIEKQTNTTTYDPHMLQDFSKSDRTSIRPQRNKIENKFDELNATICFTHIWTEAAYGSNTENLVLDTSNKKRYKVERIEQHHIDRYNSHKYLDEVLSVRQERARASTEMYPHGWVLTVPLTRPIHSTINRASLLSIPETVVESLVCYKRNILTEGIYNTYEPATRSNARNTPFHDKKSVGVDRGTVHDTRMTSNPYSV